MSWELLVEGKHLVDSLLGLDLRLQLPEPRLRDKGKLHQSELKEFKTFLSFSESKTWSAEPS